MRSHSYSVVVVDTVAALPPYHSPGPNTSCQSLGTPVTGLRLFLVVRVSELKQLGVWELLPQKQFSAHMGVGLVHKYPSSPLLGWTLGHAACSLMGSTAGLSPRDPVVTPSITHLLSIPSLPCPTYPLP